METNSKMVAKKIKTETMNITLQSIKHVTYIRINYIPTYSGKFPGISQAEDNFVISHICPFEKLKIKDTYSDDEIQMITEFLAYVKATQDLESNNIVTNKMCHFNKESDSSYSYIVQIPPVNNEIARNLIEYSKEEQKRKHSERTKLGIQHKKNKEACKNGN